MPGVGGSSESGVSSEGGTTTTTSTSTTTTTTTASTTTTATTTDGSSSSSSSSTGDGSSAESSSDLPYAPCPNGDEDCPPGWDECIDVADGASWCAHDCDQPDDCEVPATGDAEVVCAGPSGHSCALDCSDGQTCPDGMACVELFGNVVRCVWE